MRQQGWVEEVDFLVIPHPQPNELLSSWLARTAFSHGYSFSTFISLFFKHNGTALTRTDIDFKEDTELWRRLAQRSRLTYDQIFQMSIRSEEGYLFESDGLYPPRQVRILKDRRTHYGLMFCAKCLKEDGHPYWRKQWRYRFYNACPRHKVFLADRCGKCQERVRFSRMEVSDKLVYCSKCGRDLRKTVTRKVLEYEEYGLEAIEWFDKGLKDGYFTIDKPQVRSLFVFQAHVFLSWLLDKGEKLNLAGFPLNGDYKRLCMDEQKYHSKQAMHTYKDFYVNAMVYYLFRDYPENFKRFAADNHMTYREFTHTFRHASFWYKNMIEELVPMQNKVGREISESEVVGAIRYLKSIGKKVNQLNVAEIVGCHGTIHKGFVRIYKQVKNIPTAVD